MFRSGPPRITPGSPLRLADGRRQLFETASATADDIRLQVYLSDMAAQYGLAYHDEPRQAGLGQSYSEMCQPLVESLVPADQPIDLLVLAFDLHDLRLGQATSVYLSHVCPGDPLALTVCDQGTAAPFTALRLIQTYARTGTVRRALLLVAEQATLHYELAPPAPVPERHVALALLLEAEAELELAPVRQRAGVPPEQLRTVLAAEIAALGAADVPRGADLPGGPIAGRTLLLGAGLDPDTVTGIPADEVLSAPAGQPCTGAWWQLVGELPRWQQESRQLLLADYEPGLGYLSLLALQPSRQPAGIGA